MRTSSRLRALAPDLWCVDCDAWDKGFHLQVRMTVIRLPDGALWLYSPVPFDDAIAAELAAFGAVGHLVAPNLNHHKFLAETAARYPDARVWAPPGLAAKRPELPDATLLTAPFAFGEALEGELIAGHPFSNEVVFHHRPSSTLVCADFVHNVHTEPAVLNRVLWRLFGSWQKLGQNRVWRWKVKDQAAYRASVERVLAWEADRIVMAHGDVVAGGGSRLLREALG